MASHQVAVVLVTPSRLAFPIHLLGVLVEWQRGVVELDAQTATPRHLKGMPADAEPGDIGTRVKRIGALQRDFHRGIVERSDRRQNLPLDVTQNEALRAHRVEQDAAAQRLRQHERVTDASRGVGDDPLGVDKACDGKPVLWLLVIDRMPAGQHRPGLHDLVVAAPEDLFEYSHVELLRWEHHQVERGDWTRSHGVDVRDGVRRSDLAKPVRIVHGWRDEVDGGDNGLSLIDSVHRGVVGGSEPNEQILVMNGGQTRKCVRQDRRTNFGRSAAGARQSGQCFLLEQHHEVFLGAGCRARLYSNPNGLPMRPLR